MAKSENQKIKLLLLKEYLEQNTDEAHPATTAELLNYLEHQNVHAERKSLYRDIQCLEEFGCDVIRTTGKNAGYAIGAG